MQLGKLKKAAKENDTRALQEFHSFGPDVTTYTECHVDNLGVSVYHTGRDCNFSNNIVLYTLMIPFASWLDIMQCISNQVSQIIYLYMAAWYCSSEILILKLLSN